jgi:hypothetical protein
MKKRADCKCKFAKDSDREETWVWSDCEVEGHEEGCFVVWCMKCDVWSSDCDEKWKPVPAEWV